MNTRELNALSHLPEDELTALVGAFVRRFRRLPSAAELLRFHRCRQGLALRLPSRRVHRPVRYSLLVRV